VSRPISKVVRRGSIHGWIWYLPAIAVVLGVLGFETYLNIETRRNHYEVGRLRSQARALEAELLKLQTDRAEREHVRRLSEHAELMGLREAAPGEIIHIATRFVEPTKSDMQRHRATPEPSLPPATDVVIAAQSESGEETPRTLEADITGADAETMAQLASPPLTEPVEEPAPVPAAASAPVLSEMADPLDESMDELLGDL